MLLELLNTNSMKVMNGYVKLILIFQLFFMNCIPLLGQENQKSEIISETKIDSLYREDQFFIGVTYNLLNKTPIGFSNDKFAAGLTAGFLRDMPINARRNLAIAPGLGLTFNNYNQNIGISTSNGIPSYSLLSDPSKYSNNIRNSLSPQCSYYILSALCCLLTISAARHFY